MDRHARDNKLYVWTRVVELPASTRLGGGSAAAVTEPSTSQGDDDPTFPFRPTLCFSMDVNALNFCRFSLCEPRGEQGDALIALPNLVDSEVVRFLLTMPFLFFSPC